MENTLQIKKEINNQEVTFDLVVNTTNNYTIKTNNTSKEIIVRELSKEQKTIFFYKSHKLAGVMVKEIGITTEHLQEIEEIEKNLKQRAIDSDKQLKEDLINGVTPITVSYRSGQAHDGYLIFGHEAELLKDLGLAQQISGWKTIVNEELIETLGEEFTYQEASDYAKTVLEKREKKKAKSEAKIKEKLEEAERTGEKVALRLWQEDCNNSRKDCDLDNMTEFILPDGSTKTERRHTGLKR